MTEFLNKENHLQKQVPEVLNTCLQYFVTARVCPEKFGKEGSGDCRGYN